MEALASIFEWLREQEAGFSAVAAILVIAGVVFAGVRWLVSRRSQSAPEPTSEPAKDEDPLLALPTPSDHSREYLLGPMLQFFHLP